MSIKQQNAPHPSLCDCLTASNSLLSLLY